MKPKFWKLSQGADIFDYDEILESIEQRLVYVHKDTGPLGNTEPQGERFLKKDVIGDYFYLTHGNKGIYLLGQFSGYANYFSAKKEGWVNRPFRFIKASVLKEPYKRR
ncbi:hypothetical protein ES703_114850 [subsurface metagenome]